MMKLKPLPSLGPDKLRQEPAPRLAPNDKIRICFAHLCLGIDQHKLAAMYGVNPGRVSEAVTAIRNAVLDMQEGSA